jgi:hypothetical protein
MPIEHSPRLGAMPSRYTDWIQAIVAVLALSAAILIEWFRVTGR